MRDVGLQCILEIRLHNGTAPSLERASNAGQSAREKARNGIYASIPLDHRLDRERGVKQVLGQVDSEKLPVNLVQRLVFRVIGI